MTTQATEALATPELFSVAQAAQWLRQQGIRPATRHRVYVALASGTLALAGTSRRVMLIRRSDLERYAESLTAHSVSS